MKQLKPLFLLSLILLAFACNDDNDAIPSIQGDWTLNKIKGTGMAPGFPLAIPVELDEDTLNALIGNEMARTVELREDQKIYRKDIQIAVGSWSQDNANFTFKIDSLSSKEYNGEANTSQLKLFVTDLDIEGNKFTGDVYFRK
ncbi:hypothetical protein [Persicobacter psychrovividus]|uniref:Lipocalin-like domain-containing protein n=1 Tax=Persicobacter psychrovividus TaxID=387638 RepID=A0ABM7VB90_9BACT|nr:hypothetical protein PEPS_04320 [Persicobacter psychrovividus]